MAVNFAGSSEFQLTGWPVPSGTTGVISVSFWIFANSAAGTQRFWGSADHMEVRMVSGKISNDIFHTGGPASVATIVANTLYHIVATGDANTDTGQLYVNGALDSSWGGATGATVGTVMSLGNRNGSPTTERFNGLIEDWRSYNRILSANEIEAIYAARGRDGIVNGLTARLRLNELAPGVVVGAGNVKDVSNQGVTLGTIAGSPSYADSRLSFGRRVA